MPPDTGRLLTRFFLRECPFERFPSHLVDAERRVQLANDVVGRQLTRLEPVDMRTEFLLDESAQCIAEHEVCI